MRCDFVASNDVPGSTGSWLVTPSAMTRRFTRSSTPDFAWLSFALTTGAAGAVMTGAALATMGASLTTGDTLAIGAGAWGAVAVTRGGSASLPRCVPRLQPAATVAKRPKPSTQP